jgi:hypothetical protein
VESTEIAAAEQRPDLTFEPRWKRSPPGIARGQAFVNNPVRARLELAGNENARTRVAREALAGHELRSQVFVRPLQEVGAHSQWSPVSGSGSLVRVPSGEPQALEFLSHGRMAERHLYKIELFPTGEASWLEDFDAESAEDEVRTYGLGRLFELFRSLAQLGNPGPVQRAYVVVN